MKFDFNNVKEYKLYQSFVACFCASEKYAGTVITASVTFSPKYPSASAFNF